MSKGKAHHHIPNLAAIEALQDKELKFFAIIGATMSLSAALHSQFLNIFQIGTGLEREIAAKILYKVTNISFQRDNADTAMKHKLASDSRLKSWESLSERITKSTNTKNLRNLAGHAVTSSKIIETGGSGMLGMGPISGGPLSTAPTQEKEFFIVSDEEIALIVNRDVLDADFPSLLRFCQELSALLEDLEIFLDQFPSHT
jgi:hypothetical protein